MGGARAHLTACIPPLLTPSAVLRDTFGERISHRIRAARSLETARNAKNEFAKNS